MTPYELGETGDKRAIRHLIKYIKDGTENEKRLSASAINKLSKKYREDCNVAKAYLVNNLSDEYPQVREYTLKALFNLELSDDDLDIIRTIEKNDEKHYNKVETNKILSKYKVSIKNCERNIKSIPVKDITTRLSNVDKLENQLLSEEKQVMDTSKEELITKEDILDKTNSNVKNADELFFEQNTLIGKEVVFKEIFSNEEFMLFLDYCYDTKYKFCENPSNQMKQVKKFNDLMKSIKVSNISSELKDLIKQYRIFNITTNEINQYFNLEREVSEDLK